MRQLSLLELERLRNPSAPDARHVEQIAADVITELGEQPPVDLAVVASYRGIRDIRLEGGLPVAGSLTPEPGRFVMRLRADDSPRRRRFTGFHEVGHTFQPGYWDVPSFRCSVTASTTQNTSGPEQLADVAAAELLLPRSFFVKDAAGMSFGLEAVLSLAERYQASIEATALRYVALRAVPTLLVVLAPGLRKAEVGDPGAVPRLRVRYSSRSGAWPHVPRNKSAAEGGPLHRAHLGEEVDEMGTLDDLGIGGLVVRVSARPAHHRDREGRLHSRVLALYEYSSRTGWR